MFTTRLGTIKVGALKEHLMRLAAELHTLNERGRKSIARYDEADKAAEKAIKRADAALNYRP